MACIYQHLRKVIYLDTEITIPELTKWLCVDSEGWVLAVQTEPSIKEVDNVISWFASDFPKEISMAIRFGDWKESLIYVD